MRILLAEDDPTNREVLSRLLARLGAAVEAAADGAAALEAYRRSGPFDLALVDIGMPVLDGLATARALRDIESAEGRPRMPLLALTGADPGPEAARAGFDGTVQKPVGLAELRGAIERYSLKS